MLSFSQSGLLVPDSKINTTLEEFEQEFVSNIYSGKRQDIFNKYKYYSTDLKEKFGINELTQWIDGSFVTKANNPGDIDLVTFLGHELVETNISLLDNFVYPNSEKIYGVDAYIVLKYPEHHKNRYLYISDMAYWTNRFTKTRRVRGNRLLKGFLEINF